MITTHVNERADSFAPARSAYEVLAPAYDRRWRNYIDLSLTKVFSTLQLVGDERVLDVACGTGELEQRLLARWPTLRITGVDLCPEMLAQARRKQIRGDITWMEAEAANLPVGDGVFDILCCANSFHYFPTPMDSLHQFRRCLKTNGRLVLLDWCDDFWTCKLCSLWLRLTDPAFRCTYTMQRCRDMLVDAGFEIIHAERFKISWVWGMMLFECIKNGD